MGRRRFLRKCRPALCVLPTFSLSPMNIGFFFFGLGCLTHWNIQAELFVSWFLGLVCLFNIWQMTWRSGWKNSIRSFWILFSSSVLLFSPLNHDNFLWGFQIGFLLPLACVTACIWVATYVRHPLNFVFSIILCTICTFSIASGLTGWLLTTPPLEAGASATNIVQEMVGHLDSHILI